MNLKIINLNRENFQNISSEFVKIGLEVGLNADYSDVLSLHLKLGYKFDKNGIAYNSKTLEYGNRTIVDDELNLYLIKDL